MSRTNSQKYGYPPETVEKKALSDNIFQEIYGFHKIVKVSRDAARYKRNDIRLDKKSRKKLREPLAVGEKVLVLAKRLKKRIHRVVYIKVRLKIFHFLIKKKFLQLDKFLP